ncbi:MAG TPA: YqiA/YcfP family alpha/beta fold hydrolase [Burkholderiaceae bacterium]|nr:YqiA/YcfP family alpha/beta fold hydrolase [Burkholderiaceae bacterium]
MSATSQPPVSPCPPVTHLLYLHGFRSSPLSAKARQVAARVQGLRASGRPIEWWCPQLPPSPAQAVALIASGTQAWPPATMAVVGSSLGGFYATVLAERRRCRAVVLNPAVDPARDLAAYIGEQRFWHTEDRFYFRPEYVEELRRLTPGPLADPARYLAVIAKGDELLDWREMHARYAGAHLRLIDGSDHALSDFDAHIDAVFEFLGLS